MFISDIKGSYEIHTSQDLETILARRVSGCLNTFWLAAAAQSYPQLAVLLNSDLATLNYLPEAGVAGFRPIGTCGQIEPSGVTTFVISSFGDQLPVVNEAVISASLALDAAREFFRTNSLPTNVNWLEL